MLRIVLLLLGLTAIIRLQSQDLFFDNGCNYADDGVSGLISLLGTNEKADSIVAQILRAIPEYRNQPRNFVLRAASVANARAASRDGLRYILFSPDFLANFEANALTRWAAFSLFAHEVGHHVLGHDLASKDNDLRKKWELDADYYSGRVLAHLGATQQEVLAGIRNFDIDGESATHPAPITREYSVNQGYLRGIDERHTDHAKFNLPLDPTSMKKNRWNLVTGQEAEIDDEKIKVNFKFNYLMRQRALRVCLLSRNSDVAPEVRTVGSINGTGSTKNLPDAQGEIIWNYRRDHYTQPEVSADGLLRVVVYDESRLPRPVATPGWIGAGATILAGGTTLVYGFSERHKASNIYDLYAQIRDPNHVVYLDESRDDTYQRANDIHKKSQWISWGGTALLAGGGIWLYDKLRMRNTYRRDFCLLGKRLEWEPVLAANTGSDLGLLVYF